MLAKSVLVYLIGAVLSASVFAKSEIDDKLRYADSIKTKSPQEFSVILSEISAQRQQLDKSDYYYLMLLEGFHSGFNRKPAEALEKYRAIIQQSSDSDLKARALSASINIHAITRNIAQGYKDVQSLYEITPEVSEAVQLESLMILSIFFNQVDDYEAALKNASAVLEKSQQKRFQCFGMVMKMEAMLNLGQLDMQSPFDQTLENCREVGEMIPASRVILYKATALSNNGELPSAMRLLESNVTMFINTGYAVGLSDYYANISNMYLASGRLGDALEAAQQAVSLTEDTGLTKPRAIALDVISKVYEQQGEFDQALAFFKRASDTERALLDETKARQLAIQQAKNEALEREIHIKLLDKENTLLKTEAALSTKELENSRLVITLLLMLGALVIVWLLVNRKMHKELRRQARTDKLTGILNRHYFTELAESNLRYHQKTSQTLALVIFDLDLFKRINDSYGHVTGDWALVEVTRVIKSLCRKQDILGRMGGEEFAILLPGCSIEKAQLLTESFRSAVETIDTSHTGSNFTITASFGVTDTKQCGYKFDQLYACADEALYRSKHEGRNQVYCYDPSFQPGTDITTTKPVST